MNWLRTSAPLMSAIDFFVRTVHLDRVVPVGDLPSGLKEIQRELMQIALELHDAEEHGLPLAVAVRDFGRHPHVARVHQLLEDVLTLTLDEPLRSWVENLLRHPPPQAVLDTIEAALVRTAKADDLPALRVLALFFLFEALRLNLVIIDFAAGEENVAMADMDMHDLDERAEHELRAALAAPANIVDGYPRIIDMFRPAAIGVLLTMRDRLASMSTELAGVFAQGARVEAKLRQVDVVDAVLIRARAAGDNRMDLALVRERHGVVLAERTDDALRMRASRTMRKLHDKIMPTRDKPALIDLLLAAQVRP